MPQRGTKVGAPFSVLVANLTGQYDAQGNPVKQRMGFQEQLVNNNANHLQMGVLTGSAAPATATLTVADNDFTTGAAILTIGEYELISNIHYTPGGAVNLTAIAIATAISNLPGFSATPVAADVVITGSIGPDGDSIAFSVVYEGTKTNFTMNPTTKFFNAGAPVVGSPVIF